MRSWKQITKIMVLTVVTILAQPVLVFACQSSSSSYCVNESSFGSGGELNACSTSFCSKQSAGEIGAGKTSSNGFQAQGGFNTDRQPYLEFTVSNTNVDLGELTATTTKTATASFNVKSYLSHGYVVVNASDPPTNSSYIMQPINIPAGSSVGTEQFGINLVANTSPVTFGSNPVKLPDNSFSYGQVSADYATPNFFKYLKGETVAFSTLSTSDTQYTVSYLFNVSHVTPGGVYTLHHVLVATATY